VFGYDPAGQVKNATNPDGTTTGYGFDSNGDRSTTRQHDGTTTEFTYDAQSRLRSVSTAGGAIYGYQYNGDGQRTSVDNGSGTPTSDESWDTLTSALSLMIGDATNDYIYGPDGTVVEQVDKGSGVTSYLHADRLGSIRLITDPTGAQTASYTYDAYGQTTGHAGAATTPFGYTGQYTDATGLIYLRARYYDPSTAQFLTRDPLEDETGAPYSYAGSDPLDNSDPSGLDWCVGDYCLGFHPSDAIKPIVNIGRGASFGLSDKIADWISPGASCTVEQDSLDKALGGGATTIATVGWGATRAGYTTGREFSAGRWRFSPFGNSNGNRWVERVPHYHRSVPDPLNPGQSVPGQGIGRHRPWETKSPDTSFWDRW
jgi:RHS repeat-associated protein